MASNLDDAPCSLDALALKDKFGQVLKTSRPPCGYGDKCYQRSKVHLTKFRHEKLESLAKSLLGRLVQEGTSALNRVGDPTKADQILVLAEIVMGKKVVVREGADGHPVPTRKRSDSVASSLSDMSSSSSQSRDRGGLEDQNDIVTARQILAAVKDDMDKRGMRGKVKAVLPHKAIGFIKVDPGVLPAQYEEGSDVFFHFKMIFSDKEKQFPLKTGQEVQFLLGGGETPKAKQVYVGTVPGEEAISEAQKAKIIGGKIGRVEKFHGKDALITSDGGRGPEVILPQHVLSQYSLRLVEGDIVEYSLKKDEDTNNTNQRHTRERNRPTILKARVTKYVERPSPDILQFLSKTTKLLDTNSASTLLLEVGKLDVMWKFLFNPNGSEKPGWAVEALILVSKVMEAYKTVGNHDGSVLDHFLRSNCLEEICNSSSECESYVSDRYKSKNWFAIVTEFFGAVILSSPKSADKLQDVLEILPHTWVTQVAVLALKSLAGYSATVSDSHWRNISLSMTQNELNGPDLATLDSLREVRWTYADPDEYMDTYYRLIRAEAYHAIQDAVKIYSDPASPERRHLHVFNKIRFRGFEFGHDNVCLAVEIAPTVTNPWFDWARSKMLMTGNLVCISINGGFGDDVLWAMIAVRDVDLLRDESVIILELCENKGQTLSSVITALNASSGKAAMIESPTYFKPLHCVMESMRSARLADFKLASDIVEARRGGESKPAYQSEDEVRQWLEMNGQRNRSRDSFESSGEKNRRIDATGDNAEQERFCKSVEKLKTGCMETMDEAQRDAFTHALDSRLAILQGPPGTGKTYIGTKLAQVILKYGAGGSPILVMTYKNHALDEFLLHCLDFCQSRQLIRIGGRSLEPKLEPCNLLERRREAFTHRTIDEMYYELKNKKSAVESRIEDLTHQLAQESVLNPQTLLTIFLTEEQVENLLLKAPWNTSGRNNWGVTIKLSKKQNVDKKYITQNLLPALKKTKDCSFKRWYGSMFYIDPSKRPPFPGLLIRILDELVKHWMPSKESLTKWKMLYSSFSRNQGKFVSNDDMDIEYTKAAAYSTASGDDNSIEANDGDEDAEEMQKERQAHFGGAPGGKSARDVKLVSFPNSKSAHAFSLADFPSEMKDTESFLECRDLWALGDGDAQLTEIQRFQFMHALLNNAWQSTSQKLDAAQRELEVVIEEISSVQEEKDLAALREAKIVGVTVTGASIHTQLLKKMKPKVVIVEEAAEILEPSLLAALTSSVEHLILIGDHQQLRPQVDCYKLQKDKKLEISMMERLIKANYPFKSLRTQNRMRPEFAALLKDQYPDLKDNLERVGGEANSKVPSMNKAMFFWHHNHPEGNTAAGGNGRSKVNLEEVEMIAALSKFLVESGVPPAKITILSAYLGQKQLLQRRVNGIEANHYQDTKDRIVVQTVDMYQGDENDVVIISLVRSNPEGKLGFVNNMNRRIVAQSRAKRGLYFVGNINTLLDPQQVKGGPRVWKPLIENLKDQDCVGPELVLQCWKHGEKSQISVKSAQKLALMNPQDMCKVACGDLFECEIPEHACKKPCHPRHRHGPCRVKVTEPKPDCQHVNTKRCHEHWEDFNCKVKVPMTFEKCGHSTERECYIPEAKMKCKVIIDDEKGSCGHIILRKCHQEPQKCTEPCEKKKNCGHPCERHCGDICATQTTCTVKVKFQFRVCGHDGTRDCKIPQTQVTCMAEVKDEKACPHEGHFVMRKCSETPPPCKFPCPKKRNCDHPCHGPCGQPCSEYPCKICQMEMEKQIQEEKDRANAELQRLVKLTQDKSHVPFLRREVDKLSSQYNEVCDRVHKYTKAMHGFSPRVFKVEEVINVKLQIKFQNSISRGFGTRVQQLFHGTDDAGVDGITKNGFLLPAKAGMYGAGIYFATDSTKSAQTIYTKGSNKLLLCDVHLGKELRVERANNSLNSIALEKEGCDSVYAPRGTKATRGVENDEFIVFNRSQAYPRYVIHYDVGGVVPDAVNVSGSTFGSEDFELIRIDQSRKNDEKQNIFRMAESAFKRKVNNNRDIDYIELVVNKKLEKAFNAKKDEFKRKAIPGDEVLAFHATDPANILSIVKTNLDPNRAASHGRAYGQGCYFSELPAFSLKYGSGLILFRTLPGNEVDHGSRSTTTATCTKVKADADGCGEQLVMKDPGQFLPFVIYHLR